MTTTFSVCAKATKNGLIHVGISATNGPKIYCSKSLSYQSFEDLQNDLLLVIQEYGSEFARVSLLQSGFHDDSRLSALKFYLENEMNVAVDISEYSGDFSVQDLDLVLDSDSALFRIINGIFSHDHFPFGLFATKLAILDTLKSITSLENSSIFESVEVIVIEKYMRVTTATMKSIGVFEDECHPNTFQDYRVKEGMSLFNLLCQTKTPMGRVMLREWCKRPLFDLEKINERLDVVEFFCDAGNPLDIDSLSKQLNLIANIPGFMETPIKSHQQWKSICQSLIALSSTGEMTRPFSTLDFFSALIDSVPCLDIARNIESVIDFQLSKDQDRVVIKRGVDPVVDEWKLRFDQLPNLLCECADQIARQLSTDLNSSLQVIYFPQMGYIVGFEKNDLDLRQVLEEADLYGNPSEFEFVFESETSLFYKCPLTRKLDTQLGDVYGRISDREIELNFQLHNDFAPFISNLLEICNAVAFLDCTLAFSKVSLNRNFTRPVMVSDPVLEIKKGRHPLQELCVEHFVPNSFSLDKDQKIMILTGPNCSGKSVLIKQVALIVYMAHIGCFIPCESGSVIGLTDTILSKIQTRESVSKNQSSFAIDCQLVKNAISNCTERSLILLDEYGKGTMVKDGIGLLSATIRHLSLGKAPRSIIVTNLTQTLEYLPDLRVVVPYMMKIHIPDEEVVFLYTLTKGISSSTLGCLCAKSAGINQAIVYKAEEYSKRFKSGQPLLKMSEIYSLNEIQGLEKFIKLAITPHSSAKDILNHI